VCGISGVYHFGSAEPMDPGILAAMNAVQRHRGPDGEGVHVEGSVGLGNCRLAIVDRAGGQQPMSDADGRLWITYNGEVFNHTQLRQELQQRGHRFRTRSDTEVVLHAYAAYGPDCVQHLNGQFAFAVWDGPRRQLFLARDRLGIVPLHFRSDQGTFLFASEIKALLEHPDVVAEVDEDGLADVLLCSTLLGRRTLFRGIESLPPGHRMLVNEAGVRSDCWWSLPVEAPKERPASWYGERLWDILQDAVRRRLQGDVAPGALLSGGLDSSTIAKLACRDLPQPLHTFTIDFPNRWKSDERDAYYAALMARELNAEHHPIASDPENYFDALADIVWHVERPFNKGAITMYQLYQHVHEHARVVLCGEGADELLAGYVGSRGLGLDEVLHDGAIRFFPWAPSWSWTARLLSDDVARAWRPAEQQAAALAEALRPAPTGDLLNRALYLYLRYFLLELLEIHDRTGLAFGVEARPPFLDHRLVELLAPMPSRYKVRSGEGKGIFKERLRGFLPDPLLARSKTHLPIPRDPGSMLRQLALTRELLLAPDARSRRYFDRNRLAAFLDRRDEFAEVPFLAVWQITLYLLTLEQLLRVFRMG
jgi:asparagine synthase (glutamine-hydrolysing)